ncbi:MAG TPA: 23S rRNA (uracil(1939)-C(5))-methyltransferase RlmD [Candidatus Nanoarchaeia archaeon]|nr:23S rRNA (uracil(1939)-C(5))-methyltransferase RlmD [Candidatus Nanoarchaeia archaeon]
MATPKCPYFGTCGGCGAQHIDYPLQLENKKQELAYAIGSQDSTVFSGEQYGYRNRMDFIFYGNGIGLREKGKWWKIVDIQECPIANKQLNILLKEVREFFIGIDIFDVKKQSGTFRYVVIRTPRKSSSLSFVLNAQSPRIKEAVEKIKEFGTKTSAENIIVTYVPAMTDVSTSPDYFVVKGNDILEEEFLGKQFQFPVQGFFQTNSVLAEKMQEYVHTLLQQYDTKNAHLLDLYGGVGTFGVCNASLFKTVTIIESVPSAIDATKKNATKEKNVTAQLLDAQYLKRVSFSQPLFVITDPPRSGMHPKTIETLKVLKPQCIVYISCNVQQLRKDIPKFKEYRIKSAAMFDFFPHTPHSEAVVELVPEKKPEE